MGFFDPVAGFGVTFRTMFRKTFTDRLSERAPSHRTALSRPAPAESLARRTGEVRRLRAVRLGLSGRRDLRRGRAATPRRSGISPGERYGRVYQINYLRCILCGLCIEACPTRALTMTNEFELADDTRAKLIYEKSDLLAPLLPGMEKPPHERRLGDDEQAYFLGLPATGATGRPSGRYQRRKAKADQPGLPLPAQACRAGQVMIMLTALSVPMVTGAAVAFWMLAPVMILAALGMILARKPVHSALLPGNGDDLPRRAVRRAAGAPFLFVGADHRLHRRDLDALPVRADAGWRRYHRIFGRDDQGAAHRFAILGWAGLWRSPGLRRR